MRREVFAPEINRQIAPKWHSLHCRACVPHNCLLVPVRSFRRSFLLTFPLAWASPCSRFLSSVFLPHLLFFRGSLFLKHRDFRIDSGRRPMLAGLSNLLDYSALCQREEERDRRRSEAKREGRNRRPAGSTASLLSSSDINFTVEGDKRTREDSGRS